MCEYCEKEKVLKSSNFCGAAKMQIIGEFLEVQGDSHKIKWFNRIYQPSFMINYCPMCGRKLEEL